MMGAEGIPPTHASVELLDAMAGVWPSMPSSYARAACGARAADRLAFAYGGTEGVDSSGRRPEHVREVTCALCLLTMRNLGRGER